MSQEIKKELEKLNDRIDKKIIKGQSYQKEAERHKELLATLQRITEESRPTTALLRRNFRHVKSPVRRSLAGGSIRRLFTFNLA